MPRLVLVLHCPVVVVGGRSWTEEELRATKTTTEEHQPTVCESYKRGRAAGGWANRPVVGPCRPGTRAPESSQLGRSPSGDGVARAATAARRRRAPEAAGAAQSATTRHPSPP